MYKPTWPAPVRMMRPAPSPRVQRLVAAAMRRTLRRSVGVGATAYLLAAVATAAAWHLLLGSDALPMTVTLGASILVAMAVLALATARRGLPELLALVMGLTVCGVLMLQAALYPHTSLLSVTYLAAVFLAVGLLFPWSTRWHLVLLALGAAMVVAGYLLAPLRTTSSELVFVVPALAIAIAISVAGHRSWQQRLSQMYGQQFELRWLSREAARQEAYVRKLNLQLQGLARADPLTAVGNRRAMDEAVERLLAGQDRPGPARFSLALFDIDHFKEYNDRHGHLAGDRALAQLGEILRRETRGGDFVFRYGGEEFVVLLPELGLAEATGVADRLRQAVAGAGAPDIPPLSVSGGVAEYESADRRHITRLFRRADTALYAAKQGGRNRVVAAPRLGAETQAAGPPLADAMAAGRVPSA